MAAKEVWVLVADAAGARVLRAHREDRRLEPLRTYSHPEGRAKPSDLVSDRPGRSFESGHTGARHAMEPDTELKRAELRRFVHRLASPTVARGTARPDTPLAGIAQKSISPMPPPGGIGIGVSFFGFSATIASVVIRRPAIDEASCSAVRTTLAGSMTPRATRSPYSSAWASKPQLALAASSSLLSIFRD